MNHNKIYQYTKHKIIRILSFYVFIEFLAQYFDSLPNWIDI